jgi:ABC-type antimicrobial peptide transport system permease subunit
MVLAAVGISLGVPVALAGNRMAANLLYGLSPADPASLLAAVAMVAAIAALAGYLPARRASLVEPTVALRCE